MRLIVLSLSVTLMALVGCSEAPEQYSGPQTVIPNVDTQVNPTMFDLENPKVVNIGGKPTDIGEIIKDPSLDSQGEGSMAADQKAKNNSKQPILYETGAAGISFKTTLTEAESILSKPRSGPDINGQAYYEGEGMLITWRLDEPRTPVWILLLQSYLGKMPMPAPLEAVGLNHDFSKQFTVNSQKGAEDLARTYYRAIENTAENYDCIGTKKCFVEWGTAEQKDFIFNIPGRLLWLISKDRFVLYRMMLFKEIPQGPLANNVDLLNGRFLVPDEAPISFGDTFENIEARLQIETDTNVGTDTFGREYDGIYLGYQRTNFDRKATKPQPTDKLKLLQVWNNYQNWITLNGLPIVVKETAGAVDVYPANDTAFAESETPQAREIALKINLGLQRKNVRPFAEKLTEVLKTEVQKAFPTQMVASRFSGAHQIKTIKDYLGYVAAFDTAKNEGIYIQFSVNEEQGNLGSVFVMRLGGEFNAFDPMLIEPMVKPIEKQVGLTVVMSEVTGEPMLNPDGSPMMANGKLPTYDQLSGFKIGDEIRLKDWDLGRGEATGYFTANGTEISTRVSYTERGVQDQAFNTEKDEPVNLSFVGVGSLGVTLGLKFIGETDGVRTLKVASISSNLNVTEIRDLCGEANLKPTFGMSDAAFLKLLQSYPNCQVFPKYDKTSNGRLTSVYFPNDRIRVSFGDEELTSATVYAPLKEVK